MSCLVFLVTQISCSAVLKGFPSINILIFRRSPYRYMFRMCPKYWSNGIVAFISTVAVLSGNFRKTLEINSFFSSGLFEILERASPKTWYFPVFHFYWGFYKLGQCVYPSTKNEAHFVYISIFICTSLENNAPNAKGYTPLILHLVLLCFSKNNGLL